MTARDEHIQQMQQDMARLIEFKNELEAVIDEEKREMENDQKDEYIAIIKEKESGEISRNQYIADLEDKVKELVGRSKNFESRLRKIKSGKMNELNKRLKDREGEIVVLKDMVQSSRRELKTKDLTISKHKKRIQNLERIAGIRG